MFQIAELLRYVDSPLLLAALAAAICAVASVGAFRGLISRENRVTQRLQTQRPGYVSDGNFILAGAVLIWLIGIVTLFRLAKVEY